jgi:hypothetical protein
MKPRVSSAEDEIIASTDLRSPTWIGYPLRNIDVKWPRKYSVCRYHNSVLSSSMTCRQVYDESSTMCPTRYAGIGYPFGAPRLISFLVAFVMINLLGSCELRVLIFPLFLSIIQFDFGIIPTVWYFLSVRFLLAIVLSVLLQFTAFEYPFGIFKLFFKYSNSNICCCIYPSFKTSPTNHKSL